LTPVAWSGHVVSIQPRIRLTRSFGERSHSYLGYAVRLDGEVGGQAGEFSVGIGPTVLAKHELMAGDHGAGLAVPVPDPRLEPVGCYRTSKLRVIGRAPGDPHPQPPRLGLPPILRVYRERGHRRLDALTYEAKCATCVWGVRTPVELIPDQWKPDRRRYRFETLLYGPKSCPLYRAGATRKVQVRKPDMVQEEEDWIDEEATGAPAPRRVAVGRIRLGLDWPGAGRYARSLPGSTDHGSRRHAAADP